MIPAALALGTLTQAPERSITYKDGSFTYKGPEGTTQVSTIPGFQAMNMSTGRLWLPVGKKVVTFDQDGIGIRQNNRKNTSTLPSVATSTKLYTQEQVDEINRAAANEELSLDLNALSGWELIGTDVYLLVRWENKAKETWLEALVKIDMGSPKPSTSLVGQFQGFSTAIGRVNDKLVLRDNKLYVPTATKTTLQLSSYDLESKTFSSTPITNTPPKLPHDIKSLDDSRYGVTFRRSGYQTFIIGSFSIDEPTLSESAEIRGSILDVLRPAILYYLRNDSKVLLNLLTGAEISLPRDSKAQASNLGIFAYTPAQNPRQAALYTYGAFRTVAFWNAQ